MDDVLNNFLHRDPTEVDPKVGDILLSEPLMAEPFFSRAAILILDREGNGGHLGLTLNRELDATLADAFTDWKNAERLPLFCGGPVEPDRLFMLHRLGDEVDSSAEVLPGLYAGADIEKVREYIESGKPTDGLIRFFVGYSGWGQGQLTSEIMRNSWAVLRNPDPTDILTGAEDAYWRRDVKQLGPDFRSWLVVPQHPQMN